MRPSTAPAPSQQGRCQPRNSTNPLSCCLSVSLPPVDLATFPATSKPDQALLKFIQTGNIAAMSTAIYDGANVNLRGAHGKRLIHWAAGCDAEAVALLLDHRISATAQDRDGLTAMHVASSSGHCEVVRMLLEHGAQANARTKDGMRPLHLAVRNGHSAAVDMLLQGRAFVDSETIHGWKPVHIAAASGEIEVMSRLLASDARPDVEAQHERQPIHLAAAGGHCPMLDLLLQQRSSVMARDRSGKEAVDYARSFGHISCIEFLEVAKESCHLQEQDLIDREEQREAGRRTLESKRERHREEQRLKTSARLDQKWSRERDALSQQQKQLHEHMNALRDQTLLQQAS